MLRYVWENSVSPYKTAPSCRSIWAVISGSSLFVIRQAWFRVGFDFRLGGLPRTVDTVHVL